MEESCSVVDELMRRASNLKGFEIIFPSGDKLNISKWGDEKRKSYLLSLCNSGSNEFRSVGIIREDGIDTFREFWERNVSNGKGN